MRTVTLPGTTITTTVLGFGCSALLGPRRRSEGRALLEAAFDAGIRHFDVARYYGFGEAERLVGDFLKSRREQVTVTTKFGLQPIKSVARMRFLLTIARRLMRLSPGLRKAIGAQARKVVQQGAFHPEETRLSLETSLRELGTEKIDLYLLHECRPDDCRLELLEFLQGAAQSGRIGQFGIGTDMESTLEIARSQPEFARVMQFENSVLVRNRQRLAPNPDRAIINHGVLSQSFRRLRSFLATDPPTAHRWSRLLEVDCTNSLVLSGLMLNYALQVNPNGIVLFSSTEPKHIRANARAVSELRYSPEQLDQFAELAKEVVVPASAGP